MTSESRDIKLNEEYIDFTFTEYSKLSEPRQVTLDNKFPFDI